MAERVTPDPKIVFMKVQDAATTGHIDQGMNEFNKALTTAQLDNKMKAISQPISAGTGSSPTTVTDQSSNNQRK